MPEISRFLGIVIRMYFDDHAPAHFHAYYAETTGRVGLSPIGVIDGNLPPRVLSLIVEWANLHEAQLAEDWRRLRDHQPAIPIAPLE